MNDEVLKHLLNTGNKLYQLQQQWIQYVCRMHNFASTMGEERHINLSSIGRHQMQNRRWHSILGILHELKEQVCQKNSDYDRLETSTQLLETEMETLKNELSAIFFNLADIVYAGNFNKPDFEPQTSPSGINCSTCLEARDRMERIIDGLSQDIKKEYFRLGQYAYAISETLNCNIDNLP